MRWLSWTKYFEYHVFHHEVTDERGNRSRQYGKTCAADLIAKLKSKKEADQAGKAVGYKTPKIKLLFGIAHTNTLLLNYINFLQDLHSSDETATRK